MLFETLGHATLLLSGEGGEPILATDPWLIGSCYWRSWWLEQYPSDAAIARVAEARWIYITHEHPDHLHPPSLRRLGKKPEILVPGFRHCRMHDYLAENGWKVRRLRPHTWVSLEPGISLMSLPTWNNNSVLLVDTPSALIVNLNDAKPSLSALRRIGALNRRLGKRCILLRSYSPAAPIHSYFIGGERVADGKRGYVNAVQRACRAVDADAFIPFASQVEFHRADTEWANRYKVRLADLEQGWNCRTRLLPPYSRIDLATGDALARDPIRANPPQIAAKVAEQAWDDARATWDLADTRLLEDRLRVLRVPLRLLFPRGFTITAGHMDLAWNAVKAQFAPATDPGHFRFSLPLSPFKEALHRGHLGDLSIPMFAEIELFAGTRRDRVNAFLMLLILQDYGYVGSTRQTLAWLGWAAGRALAMQRALPSVPERDLQDHTSEDPTRGYAEAEPKRQLS